MVGQSKVEFYKKIFYLNQVYNLYVRSSDYIYHNNVRTKQPAAQAHTFANRAGKRTTGSLQNSVLLTYARAKTKTKNSQHPFKTKTGVLTSRSS